MSRNLGIVCAVLCVALDLASAADAATAVYDPVSASAIANFTGPASQTINGSGLAFAVPATINSIADLPNHDEYYINMWANSGSATTIVYDFGAPTTFNTIFVWNYGEEAHADPSDYPDGVFTLSNRGSNGVDIYTDNSVITDPTNPAGSGATLIESTNFSQATNATLSSTNTTGGLDWNLDYNIVPVAYTLPSYVTARYVEFNITSSYGGGFVGLSEVRFGAAPEPASLGLLGVGGAILLGKRRRRGA